MFTVIPREPLPLVGCLSDSPSKEQIDKGALSGDICKICLTAFLKQLNGYMFMKEMPVKGAW